MVNQKPPDLGIPNRFNFTSSRFNRHVSKADADLAIIQEDISRTI